MNDDGADLRSIYGLVDPRDGHVFYVGVTVYLQARYKKHLTRVEGCPPRIKIITDILDAGLLPGLVVFESRVPRSQSLNRETYWIHKLQLQGEPLANVNKVLRLNRSA